MADAELRKELVIKDLEFIERSISRMATNSFRVKAWLSSSLLFVLGLTRGEIAWYVCACIILYVSVLWYMDAYYLRQERAYRNLYQEQLSILDDLNNPNEIRNSEFLINDFPTSCTIGMLRE